MLKLKVSKITRKTSSITWTEMTCFDTVIMCKQSTTITLTTDRNLIVIEMSSVFSITNFTNNWSQNAAILLIFHLIILKSKVTNDLWH
jgi:hypothetical protein